MSFMRNVSGLRENPLSLAIYGAEEDIADLVRAYYFLELWRFIKRDYHNDLAAACQDEIGWSQITSLSKYKARYIVSHPKFRYKPNRTRWW